MFILRRIWCFFCTLTWIHKWLTGNIFYGL